MAENYGMLNNIAGGIREAMTTYQVLKNQQRQEQLLENQLRGDEQDRQVKMMLSGLIRSASGGLEYTPEMQEQKKYERGMLADKFDQLEAQKRGRDVTSPESMRSTRLLRSLTGNRDIPDLSREEAEKAYSLAGGIYKADKAGDRGDALSSWRDMIVHRDIINKAKTDKVLVQRLTQAQNLDNALVAFERGVATPQQFEELQQAVRANMGIKGTSGVQEREATKLRSMGQVGASLLQFVTGSPQDVNKFINPAMIEHVKSLVDIERKNIRKQADQRLRAVTAGQGNMYIRRPDLKADLEEAISAQSSQFEQALPAESGGGVGGGLIGKPTKADSEALLKSLGY